MANHTNLPWKVVSYPHFDNGNIYTSIQPVNVDEEDMKPLAMANGEFHVCRMSHTAAPWRFEYHRANAAFIVEACNSFYDSQEAIAAKDAEIAKLREALSQILGYDRNFYDNGRPGYEKIARDALNGGEE